MLKDLLNSIEQYLDSTTVHGFQYVQKRYHWFLRFIWGIIIVVGFYLATNIFSQALIEWYDDPVITSLDSIATPVEFVQFPTITVCNDKFNEVHDNWAAIENLFNFVDYSCYTVADSIKYGRYCNVTEQLRNDFKFFFESIVDVHMKSLLSNDNLNQSLELFSNGKPRSEGFSKLLKIATDVVSSGNMSMNELETLPVKYFNKMLSNKDAYEFIFNGDSFEDFPLYNSSNCKSAENCIKIEIILNIMYNLAGGKFANQGFGTLLRNFIELSSFDSFNPRKKLFNIHFDKVIFGNLANYCEHLKQDEKKLHEIFIQLSTILGFSTSEALSLYEIPAMLADPASNTDGKDELKFGIVAKSFYYSRCKYGSKYESLQICEKAWDDHIEKLSAGNMTVHPCDTDDDQIKKCCLTWTRQMGNNLEVMMKVMRFANGRGKPGIDLYSMLPKGSTKIIEYPVVEKVTKDKDSEDFDLSSMIPVCFFEDTNEFRHDKRMYNEGSCKYFQPVITDMGMCHAFNPLPVTDILKPSYFTKSFKNAYQYDLILDAMIHNGTESGDSFNFFVLGNHRNRFTNHGLGGFGPKLRPTKFMVGLHNSMDYFSVKGSSKVIPAGYKITWNVQAMEIAPTDGMKDISIESRKCRLYEENDGLEIFKHYSKPACEFEFRLFKAEEACKCIPWDMPWHAKTRYPICDIYGNYCFQRVLKRYQKSIKECLPGCHQLKFVSSEVREKLDADYLCSKQKEVSSGLEDLAFRLWDKAGMELFTRVQKMKELMMTGEWENANFNLTQQKSKFCKELIENEVVEVKIQFERPEFIRTHTSKRVSFPDKIGAVGGTLGLFTGMSFLSMVEIIYWCLQCLFSSFKWKRSTIPQEKQIEV